VWGGWAMSQRKTVLLVEDNPPLRGAVRDLLVRMGFDTVEASDGSAAIACLSQSRPHLVCLDLVLPDLSGYEVCEHIRRVQPGTPILIMSERSYPEDRAHADEAGADDFIPKPFSDDDFRRRVEALLEESTAVALAS